jgi:hypothetical protein
MAEKEEQLENAGKHITNSSTIPFSLVPIYFP